MADTERKHKAVSKRSVAIKPTAKKAGASSTRRTRVTAKKTTRKSPAREKSTPVAVEKKAENTVDLPTNMSLRTIEKSQVYKREFDHFYRDAMYKIAYVSGLCFLVVGASYLALEKANVVSGLQATVVESSLESTVSIVDTATTNVVSEFRLISDLPKNIVATTQAAFEVTNAADVVVVVAPPEKFNGYSTELRKISNSKYSVTFSGPDKIQPGYYTLLFFIKTSTGERYQKRSERFFMGNEDVESWYRKSAGTQNEPLPEPQTTTVTVKDVEPEPESTLNAAPVSAVDSEEGLVDNAPVDVVSDVSSTTMVTSEPALTFELLPPAERVLSGTAILRLQTSASPQFVELYARSSTAVTPTFIALGVRRTNQWVFQFDSVNVPNGNYVFFAKTKIDAKSVTSPSLALRVENEVSTTVTPAGNVPVTERPVLATTDLPPAPSPVALPEVAIETETIVKENEGSINELFKRYASAKQAGDESLVQAAQEALSEERKKIAIKTATNVRTKDISDSIDTALQERFLDLQNRIDTFESLRKERSSGSTALDTDSDGISDIDEVALYKTDPLSPDTDGDGFADGVEIMRGYNPNDATAEATITFESPKESVGLVRDDVLTVAVTPVEVVTTNPASSTMSAEIRGTGLPNSYVTLYIFSTPTVVTVRTDADGSFVYSFDKELEDGRHDVYVAITDNAGEIVAQSNPFSFVKEAQAITPIAAANTETVSLTQTITEPGRNGYNMAFGIGILAFGLILFMLGISLRKRGEETIITESTTSNDSDISDQNV